MALTVIKPSGLDLSGNFTVTSLTASSNISAGNLKTDNLLYANGSPYVFGSSNAAGSNTQVQFNNANSFAGSANFTFDNTTNTLSVTNIVANGSGLTSLTGANVTGQVGYAAVANSVAGANVTGAVSYATTANSVAVGNVSGIGNIATLNIDGNASNILYGNGSFAAVPTSSYGNANVATFLASFGSNTITTTGNVQVGNIIGNGQALTGLNGANVTGTVPSATTAGTVTTADQPNITSVGTLSNLTSNGTVNLTNASNVSLGAVGNVKITGGTNGQLLTTDGSGNLSFTTITPTTVSNGTSNVNIPASNGNINLSVAGNANVLVVTGTGANIAGTLTATGNISAGNIIGGNGAGGTISGANLVSANYITGTLTTAAQPNITSVGTLSSLSVTGNITSGNANLGNLTTSNYYSGTLTTAAQPNITSVGTLTGLTSNGTVSFTNASDVSLGSVSNVKITGGTANYVLSTDGAGNLSWVAQTGGGGGGSNIANGNSNVNIATANGNVTISSAGNANIVTVTGTGIDVAGTLNVTGVSNLGPVGNVTITGGSNGYVLGTNGSGTLSWVQQTQPANITVDTFTGNGVQTTFTLSVTPANVNCVLVNYNGVMLLRDAYSLSGANLTIDSAPADSSYLEITTLGLTSGAGTGGGAAANVFYENDLTLSSNYTISSGKSAMSTGPITIANGVSVTIPTGSKWVVL